jgi:hypothetical protein
VGPKYIKAILYNIETEKEMFQAYSVGFRNSNPQEATLAIGMKLGTTAVCQWCPSSERPRGYFYYIRELSK